MKKIYVAYKFKKQDQAELKKELEELSKIIEESTGYKTFIFFRDVQNWGKKKMSVKDVVNKAIEALEKCDAILVETSEKARGAYFEIGYAKALRKKVIIIHKKGTEADFLEATSDISIEYEDLEDLRKKLGELINK